jgi:hypothetical protein
MLALTSEQIVPFVVAALVIAAAVGALGWVWFAALKEWSQISETERQDARDNRFSGDW